MHRPNWLMGNVVLISANHIKVIKSKDSDSGEIIYENYFKRDDLGETLHILKSDNDFDKTKLIVSDSFCHFYKIKISKKNKKKDLRQEVLHIINLDLGRDPGDWDYEQVHENKKYIFILGYVFQGADFKNVKNAFRLSNIEVESIHPKVLFDYYLTQNRSSEAKKPALEKTEEPAKPNIPEKLAEDENKLEDPVTVSFPMVGDSESKPKKSRSFLHLNVERSQLLSPWMLIIFVFIIIVICFTLFGIYKLKDQINVVSDSSPTQVPTIMISPTVTPSEIIGEITDPSNYSAQIVAGTDEDLKLKSVENILLAEGVLKVDKSIDEKLASKETIIRYKSSVPEEVITKISKSIGAEYVIEIGVALEADSQYDLVILIGEPKPSI